MKQLVEFSLDDNTTFLVEVDEPETTAVERVALPSGRLALKAQRSFDQALDTIKPVASKIISKLNDLNTPADEVEVKFGLKLTADAGAVFTSVGGEVSYEITLKWNQSQSRKRDGR
ncbi:CU044_2847 family protein [Coleofasciculus sp. F4-SAH-05]|uniref:CU044_2847 family protein n=1 Tax=unclassified Coleofasciculus TaxID=2692782 RepID=UPI0032F3C574